MKQIQLKQVSKCFGNVEVIPPLDLQIEEGEFVVFVGPSGCGKSTLLRLIAGLEDVTTGQVLINGEDATAIPPAKRGLAMVFQSYALYPHMSVRKNIAFPLRMAGLDKAEQARRVEEAASVLNLTDYLDRRPGQLSGGQRQRVAIGRAIVREPTAFLFDEPLSNLDAALRVGMRLEISELHKRLATTMIYVTHDQVEAMTLGDRLMVMNEGVIEQFGTPIDLYQTPLSIFVAGFIGSPAMNFFPANLSAKGQEINLEGGDTIILETALKGNDQVKLTVGIRPEHLVIAKSAKAAGKNTLVLTVDVVEQLGADTLVHGVLASTTCKLSVRLSGVQTFDRGAEINLTVASDNVHIFDAVSGARIG